MSVSEEFLASNKKKTWLRFKDERHHWRKQCYRLCERHKPVFSAVKDVIHLESLTPNLSMDHLQLLVQAAGVGAQSPLIKQTLFSSGLKLS